MNGSAEATRLRFKRFLVEELFGPDSPPIDILFNDEDRVTVLHGRNGSGKTICLTLLHALRIGDVPTLQRYPFKRLSVELYPHARLTIHQLTFSTEAGSATAFEFEIEIEKGEGEVVEVTRGGLLGNEAQQRAAQQNLTEALAVSLPWLQRLGRGQWLDEQANESISTREAALRYAPHLLAELQGLSPQLTAFLARLPQVKFIRTDRLFVRESPPPRNDRAYKLRRRSGGSLLMVELLSQDLGEEVREVDRTYRLTSTRLDSTLRRRLFERLDEPLTLTQLRDGNRDLDEQERNLRDMGLLRDAPDSVDAEAISEEKDRGQHTILLQDRKEKLAVFSTIVAKAQRLLESLNKKLAPKKVRLNVEEGYQVTLPDGRTLPLEALSSGEQHELVLLHELLFDVPKGSLILIDEPELSLHVTWQKDLLPELLDIARLADLDFLLATHSPYIVGDRDDLMVRLGEPV